MFSSFYVFPLFYLSEEHEFFCHLCMPSTSPCTKTPPNFCFDADWLPPCFHLSCQMTGLRRGGSLCTWGSNGTRPKVAGAPRGTRGDVRGDKCCSLELTLGRGWGFRAVAVAVTHCLLWAANGDNAQSIQSAVLSLDRVPQCGWRQ